jgi:hypothetical protein
MDDQVVNEMAAEGKELNREPGVANLFGGEWGRRSRERFFDYAVSELREQIRPLESQLRETICVNFEYCKKREQPRFADGWTLAAGIADSMLAWWTQFPVPVTSISVYLVKYRVVEQLCDCDGKASAARAVRRRLVKTGKHGKN